jgi:hypothetical protein
MVWPNLRIARSCCDGDVKQEATITVFELLMMGGASPET